MVKRVLLWGKSLFIAGLQASLETVPGLDLQQVDSRPEQIRELIMVWRPDVLILEIAQLKSAYSLSLLPDFPELKVIGLDIEDNRLQVFSGSISYEPTPEQLLLVIAG
jgi:hypothetical protein